MADNTTLNAGAGGDTMADNDIGGVKYPRVKPQIGAAGTAVDAIPVSNGLDTTATGVQAVGLVGQLDDVATGTVTENQFAPVRISSRRAVLVEGVASGTTIPVTATASGNFTVIQGTGTNLHAVLDANSGVDIGKLTANQSVNLAQVAGTNTVTGGVNGSLGVGGLAAHGATSAGNPNYLGGESIAHGTNPTAVTAGQITKWYFNRAGIPFVIGGHPNVVTIELAFTAAQTDVAIVTVATGLKIVVTRCTFVTSHANTVDVAVRVGFGATNTPTTTGVVLSHPNVAAGSGLVEGNGSGILGVGADNEDLRITATVPTTGSARVIATYYTIES